jgi:hypothetical protein
MQFYKKSVCLLLGLLGFYVQGWSADAPVSPPVIDRGIFQTPIKDEDVDVATFAVWVDGQEKKIEVPQEPVDKNLNRRGQYPHWLIWTQNCEAGWSGKEFGDSKTPGARHLRIGFNSAKSVGSILAGGNIKVSVLKPDAPYPGNMGDDSQWIPAQRIKDGKVTTEQLQNNWEYTLFALWTLPSITQTRAVRFTHTALITDESYKGALGSAYVLSERLINLAPYAQPFVRNGTETATWMIDGSNEGWANVPQRSEEPAPLIIEQPESVILIWSKPAIVRGVNLVMPIFKTAEIQRYKGKEGVHPREAGDNDWETVSAITGGLLNYGFRPLMSNWIDFGKNIEAKALRLKITSAHIPGPPHEKDWVRDGRRVFLGELMALRAIGTDSVEKFLPAVTKKEDVRDLIPIRFTLPEDGIVTLVIEGKDGKRVRNLVSETPYPKGENTIWWDGMDDLARDPDAARHGLYSVPPQPVAPGEYQVRGLWRKPIHAYYEFPAYTAGNPPWPTVDNSGGWLSNHTPPQSALFVPADRSATGQAMVYLGSYVSEGGHGLAWVDLNGKKLGGRNWVGGIWTGAPFLARDAGPEADRGTFVYVGAAWENDLRLTALTAKGDRTVIKYTFANKEEAVLTGIAVHNNLLVASLPAKNQLLLVDAKEGKILGSAAANHPRGLAFDAQSRLLVLEGEPQGIQLRRYTLPKITAKTDLPAAEIVIRDGLQDPQHVALDGEGNLYVSDRGESHQVKVFSSAGKFLRSIGHAGKPAAGPYDPLHMNNPAGLTVDGNNHLWVAEEDFLPKRVSMWTLDGKFIKAFYGPPKYGGGGMLDPQDKTRFYYADGGSATMEFKLDWDKGTSQLVNIPFRPDEKDSSLSYYWAGPETAFYHRGNRYITNCYNCQACYGQYTVFLFIERDRRFYPVAAMGIANDWDVLHKDIMKPFWPKGANLNVGDRLLDNGKHVVFFIWSDLNGDGQVQPEEITFRQRKTIGGITIMPDLSFCIARLSSKDFEADNAGKTVAMKFSPVGFTDRGIPKYDVDKGVVLAEDPQTPGSSGGDQVLVDDSGNVVVTLGILPFHQFSISGAKNKVPAWSYPNLWPGLHASHESPAPDQPGQLIGTTRLMGGLITPKGSDAGAVFALNTAMGSMYFFTSDGLFISTPFTDGRIANKISTPIAERGMSLDGLSLGGENFMVNVCQTSDGKIYLITDSTLIRLEGLESIRRMPSQPLKVSEDDLQKARAHLMKMEALKNQGIGGGVMHVALNAPAPNVDGKLDDWTGDWVEIDKRGTSAFFNSQTTPYNVKGSVAVSDGKLFAAWQTGNGNLLQNSGEVPTAPFKTGGTLELMIGTNPGADPQRKTPVAGDLRLTITQVQGKTFAVLYRPVAPDVKTPKVPFSSPWRTIQFDQVEDISDKVQLATDKKGNYEISVPLVILGLNPKPGMRIQGDIGILRGNGITTLARIYWANKATAIVSDVPSEAELAPSFWGVWQFKEK